MSHFNPRFENFDMSFVGVYGGGWRFTERENVAAVAHAKRVPTAPANSNESFLAITRFMAASSSVILLINIHPVPLYKIVHNTVDNRIMDASAG